MILEDNRLTSAKIQDYHTIRQECPQQYAHETFYQHMMKASWSYGELFQGCENVQVGYGKTVFDIRVIDIGETFSQGKVDRPFLVNGATLVQSWLGSTYKDGAFEFNKPFVPIYIGEFEIPAEIPGTPEYIMPAGVALNGKDSMNCLPTSSCLTWTYPPFFSRSKTSGHPSWTLESLAPTQERRRSIGQQSRR
jgi:hypothetical protein